MGGVSISGTFRRIATGVFDGGRGISRTVMLEHSLFSLPFAVCAVLLETAGKPGLRQTMWILLAVFGARNAANGLNRLIDERIDRENPRTAQRDIPAGRVSKKALALFIAACGVLFLVSAWMLNPICFALVPAAAFLIFGYSYTKRFTWLCHFWLGVTCSAAVMGSFLAVSPRLYPGYFALTAAVALWVAGFDILYALQDLEHDRAHGLYSVPARFGAAGARIIAALSHGGTVLCLAAVMFFYPVGYWYAAGIAVAAGILFAEHLIMYRYRTGDGSGPVKTAAYTLNQWLSPVFLAFAALDIYLPGGMYGN